MTKFSQQLRQARLSLGLSQSALAQKADCTQSAISMMEGGRADAIARPTLVRIAELLHVELPEEYRDEAGESAQTTVSATREADTLPTARICPNSDCPSNLPYRVGPALYFLPRAHKTPGDRCPYCGEILIAACPACGAPIHAGAAVCTHCSAPLVQAPVLPEEELTVAWVENRQQQSRLLLGWNAGLTNP